MRELPRFNTVIANAYVRPQVAAYLDRLVSRLREAGTDAPVYMMHSGGGLISVETAAEEPVRLLESGPAGGAIFAAGYARAHGIGRALSFDMGGTTAKICLIEDGAPKTASSFEIARTWRFKKGSGMTVSRHQWSRWSRSARAAAPSPRSTPWGASRSVRARRGPSRGRPAISGAASIPR